MRRAIVVLLLMIAPALFAQVDKTGGTAAHGAESETHEKVHPTEGAAEGAEHHEKTYFGIPGWVLKIINMILFIGVLVYFVRKPVKQGMAERKESIRKAAEEAQLRRQKADQMASDIQARLAAIEQEVRAIHERAQAEGERQKRELIAAAEVEREKILKAARNEVDNRLKHARTELTEYAGQLASERAEQILRENIKEDDQKRLFQDSLKQVSEVQS